MYIYTLYLSSPYIYLHQTVFTIPTEGSFHIPAMLTPIGCRGVFDNSSWTCNVTVDLADGSECSQVSNPVIAHPLCGVTLIGLTVAGFEHYGSWQHALYYMYFNGTYDYDTGTYTQTSKGIKILVGDSTEHNLSTIHRVQFSPMSLPGTLWNGYTIPDQKVNCKL